jgi:membrane-bound lytic murein transglycosylase
MSAGCVQIVIAVPLRINEIGRHWLHTSDAPADPLRASSSPATGAGTGDAASCPAAATKQAKRVKKEHKDRNVMVAVVGLQHQMVNFMNHIFCNPGDLFLLKIQGSPLLERFF